MKIKEGDKHKEASLLTTQGKNFSTQDLIHKRYRIHEDLLVFYGWMS